MKRLFYAAMALVTMALTVIGAQHTNGNYIVVLNGNESPENLARQHGIGRQKTWKNAVHGFSAHLTGAQADRLEQDTRVAVIEPDLAVTALAQTVPTGVRRIGCLSNTLWTASSVTPINADIAILDTGIDLTHPDLNVYAYTNFTTSTTSNDVYGHGTHCAGIAAAKHNTSGVVGVAPGARLWSVKVLGDTGSGTVSSIISGVDYVTQHASEIEVASMSLGGNGLSEALHMAITNSVSHGIVYVAAAGNSGANIYGGDWLYGTDDDFFPASYPEVMTVSALADSDGIAGGVGTTTSYGADDTIATFSNHSVQVVADNPVYSPGAGIDVAAPGVNIYSTYKSGGYSTMTGTSMACPHVAGAVAVYCVAYGRATDAAGVAAIRQGIINRAEPQSSWGVNPTNPFPNDHNPEGLLSMLTIGQTYTPTGSTPVVSITSPTNNQIVLSGVLVTFTGAATDTEDGTISSNLVWNSSLQGQLGTGATFTHTLTNGNHMISAKVTDSDGNVGYRAVSVICQKTGNNPPSLTITAPTNNTLFPVGSAITFSGTARDVEDGTLSTSIKWYFNSALLATGASTSVTFGKGSFTIQACVTDSGLATTTNQVSVIVSDTPAPLTNHPPNITISYPANGASFAEGTSVTVSSAATDQEDGDLTANITVTDNLDGAIGSGGTILYFPQVGSHVLTALVSDSESLTNSATKSFTVYPRQTNTPPVITLTAPTNLLSVVSNTAVPLRATAADAQDGVIVPTWYNSMSGSLGTSVDLTNVFVTVGTNVVTATAIDAGGLSSSATVSVIVTNAIASTNAFPVVVLTAPTNGLTITVGTAVGYAATATDAEDGSIVPDWYDSIEGTLGSGTSGSYTPIVGTHRLTASATDADGQIGSQSVLFTVNNTNALPTQLVVTVSCNKSGYVNKEKARITATVRTTAGVAVSGATCLFNVRGSNGSVTTRTVTTISNGTASWALQINRTKLGAGTATVTCTASKTGSLNGTSAPVTFTVY